MTRYELLDRIGLGGMAEIFRGKAIAAGGFEKPVAIKRILPHLSQDQRFVELLIAEAKVLSLLKHRNIVQIFDVGLGDDGQYFLVMEFVDGKDIGAVQRALEAKRRRIPFDLALHVGAEICEALEHAHGARSPDGKSMALVHRDVSPSNVLLSRAGEVKLTDFGIAKRAEQDPTHGGAVKGKFAYISPEQARNEPLDPRSDVFSVGILMWELICNRRLFSNLDDLGALRAVREAQIARPTEIDPRLPAEIDQLLMIALARDKTRRYPSAGQFGSRLRSLRYSLESTVGDPAAELARIIESTEEAERQSEEHASVKHGGLPEFEPSEATVIRIRTADAFSARDNDASISAARRVIDRFEEEETRFAQISGDGGMRMLDDSVPLGRDSAELTTAAPPVRDSSQSINRGSGPLRGSHQRMELPSADDEATFMRPPVNAQLEDSMIPSLDTPPHLRYEATGMHMPMPQRTPPQAKPGEMIRATEEMSRQYPPQLSVEQPRARGGTPPANVPALSPPNAPFAPPNAPFAPPNAPFAQPAQPFPQGAPMPFSPPTPEPPSFATPTPGPMLQGAPHQPMAPPMHPSAPMLPFQQPQGFGGWAPPVAAQRASMRELPPPNRESYPPQRGSHMRMGGAPPRATRSGLKPWMLIVGALIMAIFAFALTKILLHHW